MNELARALTKLADRIGTSVNFLDDEEMIDDAQEEEALIREAAAELVSRGEQLEQARRELRASESLAVRESAARLRLTQRAVQAEAEVVRLQHERDDAARVGLALLMAAGEAILVTTADEVRMPRSDWDRIVEKAIAARRTIDPLAVPDEGPTPMERLGIAEARVAQLQQALDDALYIAEHPARPTTALESIASHLRAALAGVEDAEEADRG